MSSYIVDRRLNSKNKSAVNRQRFLRRYRQHIKRAVSDAVSKRNITDMERGGNISIPKGDISEPIFHHGQGGVQERVLPGNKQFSQGDLIPRPQGGGGNGSGSGASDSGEGEDDFVFQISQSEFLDYMFEDLELPNLVKRQLTQSEDFTMRRAGFSNEGSPGKVNIVRSLRAANARRRALTGGKKKKLEAAEAELLLLQNMENPSEEDKAQILALQEKISALKGLINRVPWLDDFDLKYNLHVKQPNPSSKAVMFCIMDVSGSMTQETKDLAKRFFVLLYLFLQRNYEKTEVVFIRHHTSAKEVDEQEFFYSRETGGTIVSSALKLTKEILEERYPASEWNVYACQASDGDNWEDDSSSCSDLLINDLLPKLQYYAYLEITPRDHQSLWYEYESVQEACPTTFAMQQVVDASDIYPVFRQLFERKTILNVA